MNEEVWIDSLEADWIIGTISISSMNEEVWIDSLDGDWVIARLESVHHLLANGSMVPDDIECWKLTTGLYVLVEKFFRD